MSRAAGRDAGAARSRRSAPYIAHTLRRANLCLPLALSVLIAGCGETKIDGPKAERLIREIVTQDVGARVASVSCPKGITAKKGVVFTCAVTAIDGTQGDVIVTGQDSEGGLDLRAPFLKVRTSEAHMARRIGEDEGAMVKVDCPELTTARKGATFVCKATADGQARSVTGRFLDAGGRFSFRAD